MRNSKIFEASIGDASDRGENLRSMEREMDLWLTDSPDREILHTMQSQNAETLVITIIYRDNA